MLTVAQFAVKIRTTRIKVDRVRLFEVGLRQLELNSQQELNKAQWKELVRMVFDAVKAVLR